MTIKRQGASPVAQGSRTRLPGQETQEVGARSPGGKTPRGGNAPHSSVLAGRIPWMEEPGGLAHGVAKSQTRPSEHNQEAVN